MKGSKRGLPSRPLPPSEPVLVIAVDRLDGDVTDDAWFLNSCVGAAGVVDAEAAVNAGLDNMAKFVEQGISQAASALKTKLTPARRRDLRRVLREIVHRAFKSGQDCTSETRSAVHSAKRSKPREGSDEKRKQILELLANTEGRTKTDRVDNLIVAQEDIRGGFSEGEIHHAVWPQKKRPRRPR
jgi:hypothetical protein